MLLRLLLEVLGTHEVGFLPRITIFVIDLIVVELLFIVYGTSSCHTKCFIIDFDLHFFPVVIIKIGLFICTELILRCSCLLLWNLFMVPMNPSVVASGTTLVRSSLSLTIRRLVILKLEQVSKLVVLS